MVCLGINLGGQGQDSQGKQGGKRYMLDVLPKCVPGLGPSVDPMLDTGKTAHDTSVRQRVVRFP